VGIQDHIRRTGKADRAIPAHFRKKFADPAGPPTFAGDTDPVSSTPFLAAGSARNKW
jgi:hypothetical protein